MTTERPNQPTAATRLRERNRRVFDVPCSSSALRDAGRRALVSSMAATLAFTSVPASAAELAIDEGVVVKFGTDAQLVVRDKLTAGKGVVLTSQKDDTNGGQTGATPQTAAPADWLGLRFEKSSAAFGTLSLTDWSIRFAGAGDNGAALTLRGFSPTLQYLQLTDSTTGLRLLDAASPSITGSSFLRNTTGLEAEGSSAPTIGSTQFVGNSSLAVNNKTQGSTLVATGNWWGHASGPRDSAGNPQGQGDAVSAGVNYGSYLATAPLIAPSIRLAAPAPFFEQRTVTLEIACVNATEYRLAEGTAFAGAAFQPLNNGRATVDFTLSEGDGRKPVSVQFRNASGTVTTAALADGGVLIDTQAPTLAIGNPAAGAVVSAPITVEASATDASGIASVRFYLDEQLVATRTAAPYSYNWNTDTSTDGNHVFRVVAQDQAGRSAELSRAVTLSRAPVAPDTEGPALSNVAAGGSVLANGATFTRNTSITLQASDRSGISRIELLLDGVVVATASGSGSYGAVLNLASVANGTHTLALRATDSLNNVSTSSYSITVAHAAPDAPLLSSPTSGSTTRTASTTVGGSAAAGASVQVLLNGQAAGAATTAGADGRFSAAVTLVPGSNQIQATATDQWGTSAPSAALQVTLDVTVPASPSNLTAAAQAQGKVRLTWTRSADANVTGYHVYRAANAFTSIAEAVKVNPSPLTGTVFDDLPSVDGIWHYRVVSVNAAGTPSLPTNQVQAASDSTLPRALAIAYTPLGRVDAATGRIGQGRVNLVITVNEALQATPYLSIVPQGGSPIPVELAKTGNATYAGSFLIDANTPSGIANALFSARDLVGNRGTDIDAGATLRIDTEGPALSGITIAPSSPIKNDTAQTVQATLTYSKPPKTGATPTVSYLLSGPVRSPIAVTGLSQVNANTWQASFVLPSDAGLAGPETLVFSSQATDDLDNLSGKVTAFNRFQVYQGNLPPLAVPFGFTAKAQPGGKVQLAWQAVAEASSYQIYRQAPGQTELQPLTRATGETHTDQTPQDGAYKYAVATVRQSNGQESLSGQSATVDVVASATAPGAPQNLALQLTGQGIVASWQPPLASTVASYNLYRAAGTSITSIAGLTPLKTGIKQPIALDPAPSPQQGAYVVTALDAAGNESPISNSAYLNASLLPVANLRIEQLGNELPVLRWNAPNGNVAGYNVYVGPDNARVKLTASPITATSFTDSGYSSGERRYTVATVDANGVEMPRTLLLPAVNTQVVSGTPIKRGVMNKLQLQLSNTSGSVLAGVRAVVRLPVNKEATQFQDHKSELMSLAANETRLVPVIVGGYAEMPGIAAAQVGVEIAPAEGELVKIARDQSIDVGDGAMVVGMATEEFTRGGTGKLRLTIENTSEVDVELLTATNNGNNDSSELRFKIVDADGNVLATQSYKQALGANVVTLTNGLTVARIPAGASYTSDVFSLNVPGSSPNSIRVRLEVDKLRYHSGQEDQILIAGRGSEKTVSLVDTAYLGEVTDVNPISSFGDQDVVITGRAVDRRNSTSALPNTRLKLILNQQGFERTFSVVTDGSGQFTYTFKPTIADSGLYKVSAVHPDITDRPEQKAFTINRVTVSPTPYKLDVPRNYAFSIPFAAQAGPGTSATNLRLVLDAASQPTGQIPAGVSVQLPAPVNLAERQRLNVPVTFTANNDAQASGSLIFDVISDEHALSPIGKVTVNYTLSEAKPFLTATPSFVETGLAQGGSQVESVLVQNKGLQDALNLRFTLTRPDGSAAPAWAAIASRADGTMAVGEQRSIDLSFTPPASTAEGVYEFRLTVVGDNVASQSLNVFASVTQSGQGNVLFKASDIYTATVDKQGRLIPGLAGARITVQNEDVATVTQELLTDSLGEALFQNLPAGRYKFRATASNHQEIGGRLIVKPGITLNQSVFLEYNLITVEWSVREITIQDRYEITLNATFETDVPAAVVVLQPASVNLPKMNAGDVYYGELSLTNHGLVRADNVQKKLPQGDAFFRYEFLVDVPTQLEPKQRVTIPYRVVSVQPLGLAASSGSASGGGCYSYSNSMSVTCDFKCANGATSACGSSMSWFSVSSSSCPAGGGGAGGAGGGGGGWGGGSGGWGGGGASTTLPLPGKKCVYVPKGGGSCS